MLQLLSLKNENAVLSNYLLIIHLSTVLSLTFPNPLSTSAMFGKVHALDCSAGPIPGARDNLLALFCLMKIIGRKTWTSSCLFFLVMVIKKPNEFVNSDKIDPDVIPLL